MSLEEKRHADREMARGLCAALEPVVSGPLDVMALEAARDVAQLLVLPGLDRLLAALAENMDAAPSPEMRHAIDRLGRERGRSLMQSSLHPFYEVDGELAALGSILEDVEWNKPPAAGDTNDVPPAPQRETVIGLMGALGGGRYADEASEAAAGKVRLTAPVAAVLRAALDWMFGDAEQRAPLRVSADAGVVELECRGVDPEGLLPAHEVIAGVSGSLFPAPAGGRGAWVLRLPAVTEREVFLMLQQDDLRLALPWPNVLRIQLETAAAEPLAAPPLPPVRALTGARHGRPVVTVGLGLRRGSLAADRLVWRLAADAVETDLEAPPGTLRAVRADDGEVFWVIDVARLMRDVPLPALEAKAPAAAPGSAARGAAPIAPPAPPAEPPRLLLLTPESVEAIDAMPAREDAGSAAKEAPEEARASESNDAHATQAPDTVDTPVATAQAPADPERIPPPADHRLEPAPAPPGAAVARNVVPSPAAPLPDAGALARAAAGHSRRVLIADDSFMARIFLMRLLQGQGYNVHSVGTAGELRAALSGESWSLVCVDVELPDARGAALVREVTESQTDRPEPAVVVALVRDARDREEAEAGGVHRTLLKPFEPRHVVAMLERAGLPVTSAR